MEEKQFNELLESIKEAGEADNEFTAEKMRARNNETMRMLDKLIKETSRINDQNDYIPLAIGSGLTIAIVMLFSYFT